MMSRIILLTATVFLALAVMIGAFGAHALKPKIADDLMQVYRTGVEYHFYHALGLLFIGMLAFQVPSPMIGWSAFFLSAGIVLFSGSLYLLALTGTKWLGAVTPLGGVSFIAGWILLFAAIWKRVPF